MEYINDININEAVIHVLDKNADAPILNEYTLELNEDTYVYIYKHVNRIINDNDLRYAKFNEGKNLVKETSQQFLRGEDSNIIQMSQDIAKALFRAMKINQNTPSGDLIIASITTDQGPMIAILKMDYVKSFTHEIQFIDKKIGINLTSQGAGLPNGKIIKAAFIKPIHEGEIYNLYVLDRQRPTKDDEIGANYFIQTFLDAHVVTNERDSTKNFMKYTEDYVRKNITDNADKAEEIRTAVKDKLKDRDSFSIDEIAQECFKENPEEKQAFATNLKMKLGADKVAVDERYVDKKLKRVRLNIDRHIDLYIDIETYKDKNKFQVVRNGDGSINLVIRNVINYIEK